MRRKPNGIGGGPLNAFILTKSKQYTYTNKCTQNN